MSKQVEIYKRRLERLMFFNDCIDFVSMMLVRMNPNKDASLISNDELIKDIESVKQNLSVLLQYNIDNAKLYYK